MLALFIVIVIVSLPFLISAIVAERKINQIRILHRQGISNKNIAKGMRINLAHVNKIIKRF